MKLICSVYRGSAREQMYLYVEKKDGLRRVPDQLLSRFGKASLAMTLVLDENTRLAVADAGKVIAQIESHGYYLQMPREFDSEMTEVARRNSKLPLT